MLGSGVGSVPASCSQGVRGAFTRLRCAGSGGLPCSGRLPCVPHSVGGVMLRAEQPYRQPATSLSPGLNFLQLVALPYSCSHGWPLAAFLSVSSRRVASVGKTRLLRVCAVPQPSLKWFSGAEVTSSWQRNRIALRPLLLLSSPEPPLAPAVPQQ